MSKIKKIEDFYKRKLGLMPDDLHQQIGHFNVMKLDAFVGENSEPIPYVRRDFYKIMLVKEKGNVHYADRNIELKLQALSFSNPKIPYKWENSDQI